MSPPIDARREDAEALPFQVRIVEPREVEDEVAHVVASRRREPFIREDAGDPRRGDTVQVVGDRFVAASRQGAQGEDPPGTRVTMMALGTRMTLHEAWSEEWTVRSVGGRLEPGLPDEHRPVVRHPSGAPVPP